MFTWDMLLTPVVFLAATMVYPPDRGSVAGNATILAAVVAAYVANLGMFALRSFRALSSFKIIYYPGTLFGAAALLLSMWFFLLSLLENHRVSVMLSGPALLMVVFGWWRFYACVTHLPVSEERVLVLANQHDAEIVRAALDSQDSRFKMVGFLLLEKEGVRTGATRSTTATGLAEATLLASAVEPPARGEFVAAPSAILQTSVAMSERLWEMVVAKHVQSVVVRIDAVSEHTISMLVQLRFQGIRIYSLPHFYMKISQELPLEMLSDAWLCFAEGFGLLSSPMLHRLKRLTDVLLASLGLLLSAPILFVAAVAIKLDSPGPVIFRQWRVGRMGKPFQLLKLRSMRVDAEVDGRPRWAAVDDERSSRLGRVIRKLHLDELPQMVNVLRGEMSLVGPRPERREFVDQLAACIPYYGLRHFVTPGLSGWAQVNYPYGASIQDARRKLQFDLFYIHKASLLLDLRILVRTMRVVLFCQGSR